MKCNFEISAQVNAESAIIDGEITAIDEDGLPCFDQLGKTKRSCAIVFYAFDLLALNGEDLRDLPLIKRKAAMAARYQHLSPAFLADAVCRPKNN